MGWALETDRRGRLHADHRAGDRPRAGVPQPGPVPRPRRGNLRAAQRRRLAGRDRRGRADLAPFGRDHRGRQAADPLRRLFALLPPRGGQRRQGRPRAAARPPVPQGRAICDLRGGRGAVGRMARASCWPGRRAAGRARNPLPGDRDLDRRHGPRQISHERHRKLGAAPRQISRDAQLLDPARLAGAPRQPPLPRRRRQGALRPHAQQYRAGVPAHPRAAAGEPPDRGRPRAAAEGAAAADGRREYL